MKRHENLSAIRFVKGPKKANRPISCLSVRELVDKAGTGAKKSYVGYNSPCWNQNRHIKQGVVLYHFWSGVRAWNLETSNGSYITSPDRIETGYSNLKKVESCKLASIDLFTWPSFFLNITRLLQNNRISRLEGWHFNNMVYLMEL